jgi:hypothetical protein
MFSLRKLLFCLLFLPGFLIAQENAPPDTATTPTPRQREKFSKRLFGGGDLGLQFGTFTLINVAPVIGYRLNDDLGLGLGPIYTYVKDKSWQPDYETSMYGGRLFGQYRFLENFLAYSEYQVLNAEVRDDFTYKLVRRNIPSLFVGGGYIAPIGRNSSFMIMGLWDLIEDPYSYYQNPVIRLGFNAGF